MPQDRGLGWQERTNYTSLFGSLVGSLPTWGCWECPKTGQHARQRSAGEWRATVDRDKKQPLIKPCTEWRRPGARATDPRLMSWGCVGQPGPSPPSVTLQKGPDWLITWNSQMSATSGLGGQPQDSIPFYLHNSNSPRNSKLYVKFKTKRQVSCSKQKKNIRTSVRTCGQPKQNGTNPELKYRKHEIWVDMKKSYWAQAKRTKWNFLKREAQISICEGWQGSMECCQRRLFRWPQQPLSALAFYEIPMPAHLI